MGSNFPLGVYTSIVLRWSASPTKEANVTLFKRRKRQKPDEQALAPLILKSEQSPCTCPEPCERDHGNE
jgi:hypothetical protein